MLYTPWWLRYLLVFGWNPPKLSHRQWIVLGLLQAAGYFSQYCSFLLSLALPQIRKDLDMDEHVTNLVMSLLPLSGILSLVITSFADRKGRRIALTFTIVPLAFFTGITALATSWQVFAAAQIVAGGFIFAEVMVSHVFLVEEMPDAHRGWAVGAMHTGSAIGGGLAMVAFGLLNGRWRLLYAAVVLPALSIAYLRRFLPESKEYEKITRKESVGADVVGACMDTPKCEQWEDQSPDIVRFQYSSPTSTKQPHPLVRRTSLFYYTTSVLDELFNAPNAVYAYSYLQEVHNFTPAHVTIMGLTGGIIALGSFNISGRLGDTFGRVHVSVVCQLLYVMTALCFYSVQSTWLLALLFVSKMSIGMAYAVTNDTLASEIFPTACRSTAQGVRVLLICISKPIGLIIFEIMTNTTGLGKWVVIPLMGVGKLMALPFLLKLPHTAGRSLDDINHRLAGMRPKK